MGKICAYLIALGLLTFISCREDEILMTSEEKDAKDAIALSAQKASSNDSTSTKTDSTKTDSTKVIKGDTLKTDTVKADTVKADSVAADATAQKTNAFTYYLAPTGNDVNGNGTAAKPWKSLKYAASKAQPGYTIHLAAGTYIEEGLISVPVGVSIEGTDRANTIIKAASSFYYHPTNPEYAPEKFLISLSST